MRTLEMILKTETKKEKAYQRKLYTDVLVQSFFMAFILVGICTVPNDQGGFILAYLLMGLYQLISNEHHPKGKAMHNQRKQYSRWSSSIFVSFPVVVIVPPLLIVYLLLTLVPAILYIEVSIKEFYTYSK